MIFLYKAFFLFVIISSSKSQELLNLVNKCGSNQFLRITNMECVACDVTAVQSDDGFSCKCKPEFRFTQNGGGEFVKCLKCNATQVVSDDGWACLECDGNCKQCSNNQVAVKVDNLGKYQRVKCSDCADNYVYSSSTQTCKFCDSIFRSGGLNCVCASPLINFTSAGYCANPAIETNLDRRVVQVGSTVTQDSAYLTANLPKTIALCRNKDRVGCQALANMCVMQIYNQASSSNACFYYSSIAVGTIGAFGSTVNYPWLFFTVPLTLSTLRVDKQFSRDESVSLALATYTLDGQFLGFKNATDGLLQLCPSTLERRRQTFLFGTWYNESCSISVANLLNKELYPIVFYEPYLSYTKADGNAYLYPIPVKISPQLNKQSQTPNKEFNEERWVMTRRFVIVDNVGAVSGVFFANKTAEFVTVASEMRLVIVRDTTDPFDSSNDGRIYAPYLEVNLTSVLRATSTAAAAASSTMAIRFEIVYRNPSQILDRINNSLSIAVGVLCAFATLYAILRTFFWSRRSGCNRFELITVLKFLAFICSAISNSFFVAIFGLSFYFLILYKNQRLFAIIPPDNDHFFMAYLISAFILKLFEVVHIFIVQCTVDIFFIDWERPKNAHAPKNVIEKSKFDHTAERGDPNDPLNETTQSQQAPVRGGHPLDNNVSIWRSYFIANEWNELQSYRKTSLIFNLMSVLFFMEVVGFGNATRFDPFSELNPSMDAYRARYYNMFRFAMIILIFGITAFVQWLFTVTLYERIVDDKLRNYVDLCSVANVSVLVLEQRQFGYYIHGRSVHGAADVSLSAMYAALRKENEGVCARRGLETDSDQQTYICALPDSFRRSFDPIYDPYTVASGAVTGTEEARTRQYLEVNKFLDRLINRTNNPRINYVYQDRKFFEDVFDGEFEDHSTEGRFYRDNGTSFGNVLFYGNELALITFDMLLFTVIDLIIQSTVLDALLTWGLVTILKQIRNGCGLYNLARKTMVDRRFLI